MSNKSRDLSLEDLSEMDLGESMSAKSDTDDELDLVLTIEEDDLPEELNDFSLGATLSKAIDLKGLESTPDLPNVSDDSELSLTDFESSSEEAFTDFSDSSEILDLNLNAYEVETSAPVQKNATMSGISLQHNLSQLVDYGVENSQILKESEGELSDDVKEKLKEIDAIMTIDASQVNINVGLEIPDPEENDEIEEPVSLELESFELESTPAEIEALPEVGPEEEPFAVEFAAATDTEEPEAVSMAGEDLDEPLVSDDMNFDDFDFSTGEEVEEKALPAQPAPIAPIAPVDEEKPRRKRKESKETKVSEKDYSEEYREIAGAYAGEMERTQATIANLRSDREELLKRIQQLEEDKLLQNRQTLSMRAELDEKKIELTIIRKKLNEEISELKDRMKLHDERRLILEEKNRILTQELDKAGQRNRIDVKKVQIRERELEQKLELLKSDAETQIRNRDLKILELKRKIDAMEFDMDSISQQEKKSVESRFELEDKLDKAIKTLRNAISVLEDDSEHGKALEALKKNIDM
jgi:DNA repair exonuclease SbcCD ATPase subunit